MSYLNTLLYTCIFVFKPKIKLKESYHSRCRPCCVVGTRWYVHPLYHSDETKMLSEATCACHNDIFAQPFALVCGRPYKNNTYVRRNRGAGAPPPNILPTQKIQDYKNNDI